MATGDTASDPFSRSAQHEARRDPSRSTGTPDPDPPPGRPKRGHRRRARPGAQPGRSDSQAVNRRHGGEVRRGAGPSPALARIRRIVPSPARWPRPSSSPWILRCPHRGFCLASCMTLRSAQSGFGLATWRRSTAISCRNTKISRSFEASLRASSASHANARDTARYTRRKSASAEDRSPAQMLRTSSGTRQGGAAG